MFRLTVYETRARVMRAARRFHLPFFTAWAWKWILFVAFLIGGAGGVFAALCALAWRGLI